MSSISIDILLKKTALNIVLQFLFLFAFFIFY